jgi:hypothetical protein
MIVAAIASWDGWKFKPPIAMMLFAPFTSSARNFAAIKPAIPAI